MFENSYCCPVTKEALRVESDGLAGKQGVRYPYLNLDALNPIPVFIDESLLSGGDLVSQAMYRKADSEAMYENFLSWLFKTFQQDEAVFRKALIQKLGLKQGDRVLVTGCGLGDDLEYILPIIGTTGQLFAQDISDLMVAATARKFSGKENPALRSANLYLSVSNASTLPYPDGYFDAAYHFGGINLFSDMQSAIHEMARVVKVGGKVLIGDEGVAPWLKEKEYGKAAICNNQLWACEPPLSLLPEYASDVHLSWVLGNCFYVIDFVVANAMPYMDMDVEHKGLRGGSMRKRYFGQLEGIDPALKKSVLHAASAEGISVSQWLEQNIEKALSDDGILKPGDRMKSQDA